MSLAGFSIALASGTVSLAWDPNPEPDIAGYRVYLGTASGSFAWTQLADTTSVATLIGLEPGTTYFCAVQAFNTSGLEGPLSAEISFTMPGINLAEISVEPESGSVLIDGQGAVEMGGAQIGATGAPRTFTIKNVGAANLSGLAITSNTSEFAVTILASPTLSPGASTAFNILFKPTATGARSAVIRIASNDADENPFDITVTGTGIALPEIPILTVTQSSGSSLTGNLATTNMGSVNIGATSPPEIFTLTNLGTADLSGLSVTLDGVHASDFTVQSTAPSILAPGESATVRVAFRPTAAGTRTAVLRILSNDPNNTPFEIALTGIGVPVPEIAVSRANSTSLTDAATTLNGGFIVLESTTIVETLTIANLGSAPLTGLAIAVGGPHASDFIVGSLGATSLAPGITTTVRISFKPSATGTRTASLQLASNDADENPFDIALTGDGTPTPIPNLALQAPDGTPFHPSSAAIAFDNVIVGTTGTAETIIVKNTGTAALTGIQVAAIGAQGAGFVVAAPPVTALAPGATTSFTVTFNPTTGGQKSASIRVTSDFIPQAPFNVGLSGFAVAVPEIAVLADSGSHFTSGNASPGFGSFPVGTLSVTRTFTIRNLGSGPLTGLSVASRGTHAGDFNVGSLGATALAPGASTTFKASFKPNAPGARNAWLSITSNDANETPFNISLSGTGIPAPDIEVRQGAKNLKDDTAFVSFGAAEADTKGKTLTFTIRNSGTAKLDGLRLSKNGIHDSDFLVSPLRTKSLNPGATASFKVTFKPTKTGTRWAAIRITSSDGDEKSFDIVLTGNGKREATSKPKAKKSSLAKPTLSHAINGIEVIDGRKYRTLTISRTSVAPALPRDVEVSSNLVDWSSGSNHTTVLINSATTLKVRDSIPVTLDAKRYIRLKSDAP